MNYRTIHDLTSAAYDMAESLPEDIGLIVGIPRSGLLAANLLALRANLPLADLEGYCQGRVLGGGGALRVSGEWQLGSSGKALVVDDSICTGRQMAKAREKVESCGLGDFTMFGSVYVLNGSTGLVDFYQEILPGPRCFEWNLMRQPLLGECCVDIDGVLCRDPSPEENDDGPKYLHFIESVRPRLRPTVPVGWLVTCRLEKYRAATEAWLAKHGIAYENLVMMDLPDKAARIASGSHGTYKAAVYKRTPAVLFVESSPPEAETIAAMSGKPVLCATTQEMFQPSFAKKTVAYAKRAVRKTKSNPRRMLQKILGAVGSVRRGR